MKIPASVALAAAIALLASPTLAGGGSMRQAHSTSAHGAARHDARSMGTPTHHRFGGPRFEQRPDPNDQNPYRPMFSLDATNPGQPHPYFQTRKDGFGYPASRPYRRIP